MKIGLFTDTAPPLVGGIETVTSLMARLLKERGHEVYTFAPAFPRHLDSEPNVYRLPSVRVSRNRQLRLAYALTPSAREAAQRLDIVHSQTPFAVGRMGARLAQARGIPHVYTYHTMFREYSRALKLRVPETLLGLCFKSFLRQCDLVVAPSADARREVEGYGVAVPVVVLPSGPDASEFDRPPVWDPRSELGISEPHLLLFVGRLAKEKNVDFLLRSFRVLLKQRSDVRLVIVGIGPAMGELQGQAKGLGLGPKITFCGFLPREKVVDLYRQADLFVFASKTETQGLVIAEAMMAGIPPVAVDAPGVREMVRSGTDGLLVPEDEQVFAACCEELLRDPERRRQLGLAARAHAQEFSAQAYTDRLIAFYQDLLQNRSRAFSLSKA